MFGLMAMEAFWIMLQKLVCLGGETILGERSRLLAGEPSKTRSKLEQDCLATLQKYERKCKHVTISTMIPSKDLAAARFA